MNKTFKLTCTAMLTALSVVANIFTIPIGQNNAISFTFVICCVAGVYLGIIPAMAVGFIGDLVAHFIRPMGAYNWFIALSTLLMGVVCALVYKLRCHKLIKLAISTVICYVVCTCCLNTLGLWLQYVVGVDPSPIGIVQYIDMDKSGIKKSFWVYFAARAPYQLINTVVNAVIFGTLQQTKAMDRLFDKIVSVQSRKSQEDTADNASADNTEVAAAEENTNEEQNQDVETNSDQTKD